ncbi:MULTISPECIES: ABC transporter permease [unclassified Neorhizobium]|uniref:ABC transporter permease n=1 Tax=unclassified Neorhizobium TaxID=2629175 RepID=UPI001FF422C5|nr:MULTISPECIES: ABC transporter permease [unclassified Neorhizobium]MCJ9673572.1 ABC transporter permease [Neorhizobium sp. SHOUNA12B]MCJ9748787.1 ABC transporter permease [Neorhizobium sp. SHOUNA12A]
MTLAALTIARRNPSLVIGFLLVITVMAMAIGSLFWTPYPPNQMAMTLRLQAPTAAHWMGTDPFGRDVLSQIMVGAQNALFVAVLAVMIGATLGGALGLAAAALRGWVEEIFMRVCDFAYAFPAVLMAIVISALLGVGATPTILAIAIFTIPVFGRLARGAAIEVWSKAFVAAARTNGRGALHISLRHILPNIGGLLIVQATTQIALAIIVEAGLSYLGIGLQPPAISWGKMLAQAQTNMSLSPTLAIFPGLMIALAVLGFNLLGDGVRDALDPRLRRLR